VTAASVARRGPAATKRRDVARKALERWRNDPVAFALDVLGLKLWTRQAEILRAVARNGRVAVRSGHKCGKTTTVAILALWYVCTRPRARVIFTAASARQVRSIVWKEIRRLHALAAKRGCPIGGDLHENPENGLQFKDGREILGFSTSDAEKFAGFSSPHQLFIVDEASGVDEAIFAAIEGNRAGGAKLVLISNPTQVTGTFYDAFHTAAAFWHGIHVSSIEAANDNNGIKGLATAEWCQEKLAEWGTESPLYQVRVLGNFPSASNDTVVPLHVVEAARGRWTAEPSDDDAKAPLNLGVDVARYGGDDTVIVARRGNWTAPPVVLTGFDVVEVSGKVLEVVATHARAGEKPSIKVDSAVMGAGVVDILKRHENLSVHAISSSSSTEAEQVSRLRDQLWLDMRKWLAAGGAIAPDGKLQSDLVSPRYGFDASGNTKVESKKELRKRIGRSTDRADALALAIHHAEPEEWTPEIVPLDFSEVA
jgi:phage terminase large subunit